ncbi:phage portal protein [Novosphingobium sp. LASN5T]|uniref:phage portal protein n=1 Tax=Novosphingobium sp. LASN5T TaxID=2491021 RepID=UPI000F5E6A87|nr:phage portal protein [Novosphingobium sp. LASN5T]RQW41379.1 phage portal protein [Novosphingobium sp. LASN5T]
MKLVDRMAHALGFERRATEPSWAAIGAAQGYYGGLSARAAENLSAVLACSTVIATSLGSIPALVYRMEGDRRMEAMGHPLRRLVRQGVNEHMSWPDFIEHMVASTLLTGNGLAEIIRNANGGLTGLRFIPWLAVGVSRLASGRLAYDVREPNGITRRLLQGEVIHLRDRTDDGLLGRSRLSRASEVVEGVQASNTFARSFLTNGAQPSGFLKTTMSMSPDNMGKLRDQFNARFQGAANAGRIGILDQGIEWQDVQISPEDAELLETRKFGVEEICRLFQVPPPLVQDYSHNTFTNSETAGRWFAMFTLTPWARKIETEFARSVFPASGTYEMELDLSGFLRGDPATRWNAHKIAIDAGVLDPDEVRQVEGWNPRAKRTGEVTV